MKCNLSTVFNMCSNLLFSYIRHLVTNIKNFKLNTFIFELIPCYAYFLFGCFFFCLVRSQTFVLYINVSTFFILLMFVPLLYTAIYENFDECWQAYRLTNVFVCVVLSLIFFCSKKWI